MGENVVRRDELQAAIEGWKELGAEMEPPSSTRSSSGSAAAAKPN
jgi:hypothetical protein